MKHEQTIVTHSCDMCKKECKPVREVEVTSGQSSHGPRSFKFIPIYSEDWVTKENGDICMDCILSEMRDFLKRFD
ncbi:hypothetical protein QQ39_06380 [Pragia fontium]|nr:hypothetical protein QQ39_06380 [Pragia fontium]